MDTRRESTTDRWYDIREIWTGLSGGLYYSDSIDSSGDQEDAIRRALELLWRSAEGASEMTAQEYDRVSIEIWEMDGDDEVRRVWHGYRDFDLDID